MADVTGTVDINVDIDFRVLQRGIQQSFREFDRDLSRSLDRTLRNVGGGKAVDIKGDFDGRDLDRQVCDAVDRSRKEVEIDADLDGLNRQLRSFSNNFDRTISQSLNQSVGRVGRGLTGLGRQFFSQVLLEEGLGEAFRAAIIGVGRAIQNSAEVIDLPSTFAAQFGLIGQEAELAGQQAAQLYAAGFGDSVSDASDAIGSAIGLGLLDTGEQISESLEATFRILDATGTDLSDFSDLFQALEANGIEGADALQTFGLAVNELGVEVVSGIDKFSDLREALALRGVDVSNIAAIEARLAALNDSLQSLTNAGQEAFRTFQLSIFGSLVENLEGDIRGFLGTFTESISTTGADAANGLADNIRDILTARLGPDFGAELGTRFAESIANGITSFSGFLTDLDTALQRLDLSGLRSGLGVLVATLSELSGIRVTGVGDALIQLADAATRLSNSPVTATFFRELSDAARVAVPPVLEVSGAIRDLAAANVGNLGEILVILLGFRALAPVVGTITSIASALSAVAGSSALRSLGLTLTQLSRSAGPIGVVARSVSTLAGVVAGAAGPIGLTAAAFAAFAATSEQFQAGLSGIGSAISGAFSQIGEAVGDANNLSAGLSSAGDAIVLFTGLLGDLVSVTADFAGFGFNDIIDGINGFADAVTAIVGVADIVVRELRLIDDAFQGIGTGVFAAAARLAAGDVAGALDAFLGAASDAVARGRADLEAEARSLALIDFEQNLASNIAGGAAGIGAAARALEAEAAQALSQAVGRIESEIENFTALEEAELIVARDVGFEINADAGSVRSQLSDFTSSIDAIIDSEFATQELVDYAVQLRLGVEQVGPPPDLDQFLAGTIGQIEGLNNEIVEATVQILLNGEVDDPDAVLRAAREAIPATLDPQVRDLLVTLTQVIEGDVGPEALTQALAPLTNFNLEPLLKTQVVNIEIETQLANATAGLDASAGFQDVRSRVEASLGGADQTITPTINIDASIGRNNLPVIEAQVQAEVNGITAALGSLGGDVPIPINVTYNLNSNIFNVTAGIRADLAAVQGAAGAFGQSLTVPITVTYAVNSNVFEITNQIRAQVAGIQSAAAFAVGGLTVPVTVNYVLNSNIFEITAAIRAQLSSLNIVAQTVQPSVSINVSQTGAEAATAAISAMKASVDALTDKTISVIEEGASASEERVRGLIDAINTLSGKSVDVVANVSGTDQVNALADAINRVQSRVVTVTARRVVTGPSLGGGGSAVFSADGRIVNRPLLSWVGEAGPEAIIPLTRPRRALELLQQSGLDRLLFNASTRPVGQGRAARTGQPSRSSGNVTTTTDNSTRNQTFIINTQPGQDGEAVGRSLARELASL